MPRTLMGHGSAKPPGAGGRSASPLPDAINLSVRNEPRNCQNYPYAGCSSFGTRERSAATRRALARQMAGEAKKAGYSLCGVPLLRVMPDEPGSSVRGQKEAKAELAYALSEAPEFDAAFQATFAELLAWRRDVRHFRPEEAPDEATLAGLFDLAALAPSVGNCQPTRFVRVDDKARRASIRANFEAVNRDALSAYAGERAALYARLKLAGLNDAPIQLAVFCDEATQQGHGLGARTMPKRAAIRPSARYTRSGSPRAPGAWA